MAAKRGDLGLSSTTPVVGARVKAATKESFVRIAQSRGTNTSVLIRDLIKKEIDRSGEKGDLVRYIFHDNQIHGYEPTADDFVVVKAKTQELAIKAHGLERGLSKEGFREYMYTHCQPSYSFWGWLLHDEDGSLVDYNPTDLFVVGTNSYEILKKSASEFFADRDDFKSLYLRFWKDGSGTERWHWFEAQWGFPTDMQLMIYQAYLEQMDMMPFRVSAIEEVLAEDVL